MSSEIV